MAGLPQVQKAKLDAAKAAEAAGQPPAVHIKPAGATAVVSMTPGPREPAKVEEPLDEASFAVEGTAPAPVVHDVDPTPEVKDFEKESKEYFHKWKTVAGLYEKAKSDLASLKEEVEGLKGEMVELKKAPKAPTPAAPLPEEDITEEERTTYGSAFPVVQKLGKKVAGEVVAQIIAPYEARIAAIEAKVGKVDSLETRQTETDERTFFNNVRNKVPDLDTIVASPEWADYVAKKVPYGAHTFADAIGAAHKNRDLETLVEIFHGFKPAKDSLESLVTPAVQRNAGDPSRQTQKPMLKMSERKKASEDFRKGRISKERFSQIDAMYKTAEAEGRLDLRA